MNKILWILVLIIFSIGNSSELVEYPLYQYCIECLTKYYRKKQNITEGQIEDFKIFDGYNKVYYRKLNFDKETYPYYIEILLSDKNKRLPHKEEEVVYRNLAEKKLKNIHFPSKKLKYYIENYAYDEKMSDKAIMQDNSLYKYDFVQIIDNTQYRDGDKEFNSPERYVVQQKIDLTNDIEKIFDTNHAFSIVTPAGIEIFVHLGMDTVKLEGKGFERIAEEGAVVKAGDPIVKYDYDFLKANAKSIITPVIISNYEDYASLNPVESGTAVAGETLVLNVEK